MKKATERRLAYAITNYIKDLVLKVNTKETKPKRGRPRLDPKPEQIESPFPEEKTSEIVPTPVFLFDEEATDDMPITEVDDVETETESSLPSLEVEQYTRYSNPKKSDAYLRANLIKTYNEAKSELVVKKVIMKKIKQRQAKEGYGWGKIKRDIYKIGFNDAKEWLLQELKRDK